VPEGLREYGKQVRGSVVARTVAEATAERFGISLYGGNGIIGALGAVALTNLPNEVLLDPSRDLGE
jgi:tRNA(Ile2) C34 agmatinyltransferase TiaS